MLGHTRRRLVDKPGGVAPAGQQVVDFPAGGWFDVSEAGSHPVQLFGDRQAVPEQYPVGMQRGDAVAGQNDTDQVQRVGGGDDGGGQFLRCIFCFLSNAIASGRANCSPEQPSTK